MLNRLRLALRTVLLRRRLDREMQDEMERHIAQSTQRLMARGLSEREARHAARREFGNVDSLQEQARDARGSRWVESTIADLRFGLRHFRKIPVSTATMILLLALGVGVNTGFFTILYSVRTMPPTGVAQDERLVRIRGTLTDNERRQTRSRPLSFPEIQQYAAQTQLFSEVAAGVSDEAVISVRAGETRTPGLAVFVSESFFRVIGVQPILGAGLPSVSDDRAAPVAVINYAIWDDQFGRSPDVIGKTIQVNDLVATIVGVAPEGFYGAWSGGSAMRVWFPLAARADVLNQVALASYDSTSFAAVALLRPGVRLDQAIPTVQLIAGRAAEQIAQRNATITYSADVAPLLANNERIKTEGDRIEDLALLGAVTLIGLLVLVITCTNVSTLLIGLAAARRQEIAVRLSLGAARSRLVRQLVTESVLLATAGGVLAIGVLWIIYRAFGARFPDVQLSLDWTSLAFAFGFAVATGLLFGTSPALHATRLAVADVLKNSAASVVATRSRLHGALVVVQIAATQPLLVGLGASMMIVLTQFDRSRTPAHEHNIVVADFSPNALPLAQLEPELQRLRERFAGLPGVVGVVRPPRNGSRHEMVIHPADRPVGVDTIGQFAIRTFAAPPGYFDFFDGRILLGRDFNAQDVEQGHTVILGRQTARRLFGQANPIGRRLVRAEQPLGDTAAMVVVGVVNDSSVSRADVYPFMVYTARAKPATAMAMFAGRLLIQTDGPAVSMIPLIRSVANGEAPNLPLISAQTMAQMETNRRANSLRASTSAAAVGLVALFLSTIGLYSIVAFAVSQRAREIGIRTALGANRREVVGLFFYRGLKLGLMGLFVGLPLGILVMRFLTANFLFVPLPSPTVLSGVIAALVLAVGAVATWIPARRAAGIDPLNALRAE
ncbi:MAG: ABC transporter permease [Gemmatimonadota bacterium]